MWHSVVEILWFTVAYPVSLLIMVAIGYFLAERNYRRRARIWKPSGIENALITIFGLLLSFTLLAANNSLRDRTTLIHQTSDAVTELYRESQLLPPAESTVIRSFLLQFLALELQEHQAGHVQDATHPLQLAQLYNQAWQAFRVPLTATTPQATALQRLVPAFNRLNSATSRLHYARQERTPYPIIALLIVSSWAIGILVGFTNNAQESRHYFVPALFVIISVLTVQAIRDLDNPELGFIRPNYANLADLQRMITSGLSPSDSTASSAASSQKGKLNVRPAAAR